MNIKRIIQSTEYPEYIKEYILKTQEENADLFLMELRKAENSSKNTWHMVIKSIICGLLLINLKQKRSKI